MAARQHPVVLESEALRVTVNPLVGGTITAIEHKGLGASVLGTVPWEPEAGPADNPDAAPDEKTWLTRYGGGWPLLFPNGGDACDVRRRLSRLPRRGVARALGGGRRHGAALRPDAPLLARCRSRCTGSWRSTATSSRSGKRCACWARDRSRVMWGHHPTFGSDLLAGPFEIQSGARNVTVDDRYDPAEQSAAAGRHRALAHGPGKDRIIRPQPTRGHVAALAYLHDFDSPWASIRRLDDSVAAALSWDAGVFPCAWLWYELGGTQEPPWCGKARLIGMEPNTTWPANGLADASRRGGRLLTWQPGAEIATTVRLHVFKPAGAVRGVDTNGRAISKRAA